MRHKCRILHRANVALVPWCSTSVSVGACSSTHSSIDWSPAQTHTAVTVLYGEGARRYSAPGNVAFILTGGPKPATRVSALSASTRNAIARWNSMCAVPAWRALCVQQFWAFWQCQKALCRREP
ncbi:Piso0_000149 [Millerozyma farinosa CBS 7064]|uniref:Piso0_000149 protein n=1 Tax=Pichia sorbitophila (strain ATCC MYA-4447 / BCRC 22081 / CBS 7064 / NBRC 10061 / NRRL Y-12695) TaxID=559304 RepID=G8YUN2_PICSO|nr:Piso0_000149 [Millerozyma farinosa CBS 7064]